MAIQMIGSGTDPMLRQLMASQQIGQAIGQFAPEYRRQQEQQALVDLLGGKPGQMTPGQMNPAQMTVGSQAGTLGTPPTAGLMQGIPREQIENIVAAGGGGPLFQQWLAQRFPEPQRPVEVRPGGALVDPATGQAIYQAPFEPAEPEGPLSSAGKIAADLGVDIRTPEGRAAVESIIGAGGTTISLGGPTGPAATIASMAPGAMSDIAGIAQQLVDPAGNVNSQLLTTMNVPGLNMAVPGTAGAQMRSALEGAMDTMVRIRTGAAATQDEIAQMREVYMPSPLDTAATVRSKLDRLRRDLDASLAIATQGKAVPESTKPGAPSPPAEQGLVDKLIQQGMEVFNLGTGESEPAAAPASPAAPSTDDYGEGEIVRNPQTGERLILRNGQWVPYSG